MTEGIPGENERREEKASDVLPAPETSSQVEGLMQSIQSRAKTLYFLGYLRAGQAERALTLLHDIDRSILQEEDALTILQKNAAAALDDAKFPLFIQMMILLKQDPLPALQEKYLTLLLEPADMFHFTYPLEETYKRHAQCPITLPTRAFACVEECKATNQLSTLAKLLPHLPNATATPSEDLQLFAYRYGPGYVCATEAYQIAKKWGVVSEQEKWLKLAHAKAFALLEMGNLRESITVLNEIDWTLEGADSLKESLIAQSYTFLQTFTPDFLAMYGEDSDPRLSEYLTWSAVRDFLLQCGSREDIEAMCTFNIRNNGHVVNPTRTKTLVFEDARALIDLVQTADQKQDTESVRMLLAEYVPAILPYIAKNNFDRSLLWLLNSMDEISNTTLTDHALLNRCFILSASVCDAETLLKHIQIAHELGLDATVQLLADHLSPDGQEAFLSTQNGISSFERFRILGRTDVLLPQILKKLRSKKTFIEGSDNLEKMSEADQQQTAPIQIALAKRHLKKSVGDASRIRWKEILKWKDVHARGSEIEELLTRAIRLLEVIAEHMTADDIKYACAICECIQSISLGDFQRDDVLLTDHVDGAPRQLQKMYELIAAAQIEREK